MGSKNEPDTYSMMLAVPGNGAIPEASPQPSESGVIDPTLVQSPTALAVQGAGDGSPPGARMAGYFTQQQGQQPMSVTGMPLTPGTAAANGILSSAAGQLPFADLQSAEYLQGMTPASGGGGGRTNSSASSTFNFMSGGAVNQGGNLDGSEQMNLNLGLDWDSGGLSHDFADGQQLHMFGQFFFGDPRNNSAAAGATTGTGTWNTPGNADWGTGVVDMADGGATSGDVTDKVWPEM
jgi:hypothetical protein